MDILTYPLGQMQGNCYVLVQRSECIIIDPSDSADFILEEIARRKLSLLGMFATHGHFDHIMAAGEIQLSLGVPLCIFKEDRFLIDRVEETARHFLGYEPTVVKPNKVEYLKEGKNVVGPFSFEVLHIPGHTPGSAAYYFSRRSRGEAGFVFTGDTLFQGAIGRYDFSYSDKTLLKKSLEKLLNLPRDTIVYPGHGEPTTIRVEKIMDLSFL